MKYFAAFLVILVLHSALIAGDEDWVEESSDPYSLNDWLTDLRQRPLDLQSASVEEIAALPHFATESAQRVHEFMAVRRPTVHGLSSLLTSEQMASLLSYSSLGSAFTGHKMNTVRGYLAESSRDENDSKSGSTESRIRADFHAPGVASGFALLVRRGDATEMFEQASIGIEIAANANRPRLLAGDYWLDSGTGLVSASAFGSGQWVNSPDLIGTSLGRGLVSRPSRREGASLRGAATEWKSEHVLVSAFGSHQPMAAGANESGDIEYVDGEASTVELARAQEGQVRETVYGACAQANSTYFSLGCIGTSYLFEPPFSDQESVDDMPSLIGDRLQVWSAFASGRWLGLNAVSEFAHSSLGGSATQVSMQTSAPPVAFGFYYVYASEDFFSPRSAVWGGYGSDAQNVFQTGTRIRWTSGVHVITVMGSFSRTPDRTPSNSLSDSESGIDIRYAYRGAKWIKPELRLIRRSSEEGSLSEASYKVNHSRIRLDAAFPGADAFKLRVEFRAAESEIERDTETGTLTSIGWERKVQKLTLTSRVTVFRFESSRVAAVVYESTLPMAFPLVSLSGTGSRWSAAVGKEWNSVTATIHSGLQSSETASDSRTELSIGAAIQFRFAAL